MFLILLSAFPAAPFTILGDVPLESPMPAWVA